MYTISSWVKNSLNITAYMTASLNIQSAATDPKLVQDLRQNLSGEVLFDAYSCGRYSTDASIYQMTPLGVVVPRNWNDVITTVQICAEYRVPVLARGGGTSQCGQTVGKAVVMDLSKHLNHTLDVDIDNARAVVEPGLVLDQLNAQLAPHRHWFPVDVSTASRATLGGMAGNNSCGARSIYYGTMRNNVAALDVILASGQRAHVGTLTETTLPKRLTEPLLAMGAREAKEIGLRFPDVQRRVGGYNIDALVAKNGNDINLAHLLVGSEGTLALSERIHLNLAPLPTHKLLGVCHFPTFYSAMDAAQHIVKLGPRAVELVDRTMIELSRDIPMFRATLEQFVSGEPDALLLVEFAGEDQNQQQQSLQQLVELMCDLGFPNAVVRATDPAFQKAIWEVRKAGLNIMMSMKGDGKPVSFIEDCAVRLEDLAEYTDRLTKVFHKHGTTGTWYAHASVGCLHVRPVLNLKLDTEAKKMRAIAEEAFSMVQEYKGSHSGEHGDGLSRSEFHEKMFGRRMVENFAEVKNLFDPQRILNPGKIVDPPKMDDRMLFRYKPGYKTQALDTVLDWSTDHGFAAAVEMCNNNGACRKRDANVMCPSFRVTGDEQHVTRGRANTLRLALSGQLGVDAFTDPATYSAMQLCVSCKGCKRECPTGVDMAKMKIEFLHHYYKRHRLPLRERLVANLPRYAPTAARLSGLLNLRNRSRLLAQAGEKLLGFSAQRPLPQWSSKPFREPGASVGKGESGEVVLLVDTFNRYFEPHIVDAAVSVLQRTGFKVHFPTADTTSRPLCCGRTFLSAGLVEKAREEARRSANALRPYVERGMKIVGLEPSCLFGLRDEWQNLIPNTNDIAQQSQLIDEFLAENLDTTLDGLTWRNDDQRVLVHGHCHQKAFDTFPRTLDLLNKVPGMQAEPIQSSCCGMAGAFGYQAENFDVSQKMGEADLLPAVRKAGADTVIVANGTSCRQQIRDGAQRSAQHVIELIDQQIL